MSTSSPDLDTLARDLIEDLGAIRRLLRRRVRMAMTEPALPTAQIELLRLVEAEPGIRVGDAARALRLAPNTVSTLLRELKRAGLLESGADATDGRAVHLSLTEAARHRLVRWRDERSQVLSGALSVLSEADLLALEAGQVGLRALIERLEEGS
ncbi:MAG: MarR family transcriptional regulator [Gaiellaceae bacterium]|jgi:DNA-binding MarR family transcriptional regulator